MIALPLLILFVLYAGPMLFNGVLCLLCAIGLYEFYAMGLRPSRRNEALLGVAVGTVLAGLIMFGVEGSLALGLAILLVFGVMMTFLFRPRELADTAGEMGIVLLGLAYVPLLLSHAGLLRSLPSGHLWIFSVLFLVMASDSAAYFVGRSLGRRKLYPAVSPKKTIEGSCGGLVGGLIGLLVFSFLFFPQLRIVDILLLGAAVGLFSQLGDLFESLLKRSFGVKDSGSLIPGHGGILDRLDSLLFAFPVTYYYVIWLHGG